MRWLVEAVRLSMCHDVSVTGMLSAAATPGTNGTSQATALQLLCFGALFAALGISALVFRSRLWTVYQGMTRPMGPTMARFQYVISCLVSPAMFAFLGIVAFVLGLIRI
jgi:hypothetical protein